LPKEVRNGSIIVNLFKSLKPTLGCPFFIYQ